VWSLAETAGGRATHRCKKRFLRFFILVTFLRFLTFFFIFQTIFIFKKRWQSSERQTD